MEPRTTYAVVTKASIVHDQDEPETEREDDKRLRRRSNDELAAVKGRRSRAPKEVTTTLKSPD